MMSHFAAARRLNVTSVLTQMLDLTITIISTAKNWDWHVLVGFLHSLIFFFQIHHSLCNLPWSKALFLAWTGEALSDFQLLRPHVSASWRVGLREMERDTCEKILQSFVSPVLFPQICFKNQIRLAGGALLFPCGINLKHFLAMEKTFKFALCGSYLYLSGNHLHLFTLNITVTCSPWPHKGDVRIRLPDAVNPFLRDQFEFQSEVRHFAGLMLEHISHESGCNPSVIFSVFLYLVTWSRSINI